MISEIILMIRLAMRALLTKHMPPHNSKLIRFLQNMTHFLICWSIFIRKKVGQPMDKLIPRIISVNLLAIHRLMLKPLLNVTVFPNILKKKFIFFSRIQIQIHTLVVYQESRKAAVLMVLILFSNVNVRHLWEGACLLTYFLRFQGCNMQYIFEIYMKMMGWLHAWVTYLHLYLFVQV